MWPFITRRYQVLTLSRRYFSSLLIKAALMTIMRRRHDLNSAPEAEELQEHGAFRTSVTSKTLRLCLLTKQALLLGAPRDNETKKHPDFSAGTKMEKVRKKREQARQEGREKQ